MADAIDANDLLGAAFFEMYADKSMIVNHVIIVAEIIDESGSAALVTAYSKATPHWTVMGMMDAAYADVEEGWANIAFDDEDDD